MKPSAPRKRFSHRRPAICARGCTPKLLACALGACLAIAAPTALAQSTAATVRGQVSADSAPAADATVTATNLATGLTRSSPTKADGSYSLAGLPPGTYRIDVSAAGQTRSQNVTLLVGQTVTLNLGVGGLAETAEPGAATELDTIVVTAPLLLGDTASSVATYVTQKQIDALPQNSRNFLAFADTVPGMSFTTTNNGESQLRSGAQSANAINVYIDGVGQKNYVTAGGLTGQDDSRGNPFPQLAIGEYKVITSNYKAEFAQISSAAVVAVTKSGTNDFSGSFFYDRTSDQWREPTPDEEEAGEKAEELTEQYGMSVSGPIIEDRLHYFFTYEAKDFVVPRIIEPAAEVDRSTLSPDITRYYGPASQPFNEDVYFAKLSFTADESNLLELTARYRNETGILDVGNNVRTESSATALVNDETRMNLRWQYSTTDWLNDAQLTYEESAYNPTPVTQSPGLRYTVITPNQPDPNRNTSVLWLGGGTNFQDKGQQGWGIQDELTYFGRAGHTIKMGFKYKKIDLNAFQFFPPYPQYFYDVNDPVDQPYQLQYAQIREGRDPFVTSENKQFGIFIQDDWQVTDKLLLNLGIRYDYEINPSFEDYRVDDDLVQVLRTWENIQNTDYDINDYISTGTNRNAFAGAIQPRLGFSYDVNGDQSFVVFGGAGRAYDRNLYDYLAREFYSGASTSVTLGFETPLHPCDERTCVPFDPALLTPEGLAAYAAANPSAGGEVFLINNDLTVPYSDQYSIGVRNLFDLWGHGWSSSVAVSHIRSYDGIYFRLGNRRPDGSFHEFPDQEFGNPPFGFPPPGYGSLILGDNGFEFRNTSLLVSLRKPFTEESGWGFNLAYTFTDGEENRPNASESETFLFDYPFVRDEFFTSTGVPDHRLVLSGIWTPGWDLTFSGKLIVESPTPLFGVNRLDSPPTPDNSQDNRYAFYDPVTPDGTIGFKQLDLAVEKRWNIGRDITWKLRADVLNVFNWRNWTQFSTFYGPPGGPRDPDLGSRNGNDIRFPTRTFKLSVGMEW